ncbi:hypothetical protein [Salinarimonas sp.]|uniref:hypothetical protein n=1 Tax=Salinarimonas sp. TaxID=2766526 RepID=UPI0032D8D6FE
MPNTFAYLMLLAWPIVTIVLFRMLSHERALIWTLLGGYLLLPPVAAFDLPLVPPLDKTSIPNLVAATAIVLVAGPRLRRLRLSLAERVLLAIFVVSPLATVIGNPEAISLGSGRELPGLSLHDSFSMIANQLIFLIPYFLGRQLLATPEAQRDLLLALAIAGLAYSLPMLLEVRLSPQLNVWIYGFFQHSFEQMMRAGGYRPIVFLPHGLHVAFFAFTVLLAVLGLWRAAAGEARLAWFCAAVYVAVVLVLCKSYASLAYALVLAPVVAFAGRRRQLTIAAALALLVLSYPLLRGADLVPTDFAVEQAAQLNTDRAGSLQFRFDNEESLLAHAEEKPLFGWGGWGRNQLYDETGRMVSVTDGRWIIVIGVSGWLGFIAEFGLLCLALLSLRRSAGAVAAARLSPFIGVIALIQAANLVDLIPNSSLIPLTWLIAGALVGYARALRAAPVAALDGEGAHAGSSLRAPAARSRVLAPGRPYPIN